MKVTLDLPPEVQGLPEEELRQLFLIGLREMRVEKAIVMLRKGDISVGKAAKLAGLSLREMIEEARRRGVEPRVTDEMIEEIQT